MTQVLPNDPGRAVTTFEVATTADIMAFTVASVALLASPGPATLALAASGAVYGLKASLRFFSGIMIAVCITLTIVACGFLVIITQAPWLSDTMSLLAAAYILFLAYKIARTVPSSRHDKMTGPTLAQGLILGLLNIKAYAVFAALFGGFALGIGGLRETLLKGLICVLIILIGDFLWLCAGSYLRNLFRHPLWGRVLNAGFAAMLIIAVAGWFLL